LILHTVPSSVPRGDLKLRLEKTTSFFLPSYFVGRQVPRAQIFRVVRSSRKVKARLPTLRPSIRVWVPHLGNAQTSGVRVWSVRADKSACFCSQLFSVDRKWTGLLRRGSREDNNRNTKNKKEKQKERVVRSIDNHLGSTIRTPLTPPFQLLSGSVFFCV
jgi:hypothetical protein